MTKQILIVDDSASIRSVLSHTIVSLGHAVDEATGGRSALEKMKQKRYDLIVTDQNMPSMEGLDLVKNMRKTAEYATMPILVLTTETSDNMTSAFRQAGANAWMFKPFSPERMTAALTKLL